MITQEEKTRIEARVVDVLKTVYDPEIPVNIFDLGMIYKIDLLEDGTLDLDMTFTAPSCPAADFILEDVRTKVEGVEGVKAANVNLVFEPAWDQSMMSEEARVETRLRVGASPYHHSIHSYSHPSFESSIFPFRRTPRLAGTEAQAHTGATTGEIP
jgi:FeS assembly SUF system protein